MMDDLMDDVGDGKTNLLVETIEALRKHGKTPEDVQWIGTPERCFNWMGFEMLAKDFKYDAGLGSAEVNSALLVVGEDWWLERGEYDGAEWWSFKCIPELPKVAGLPDGEFLKSRGLRLRQGGV